MNELQLWWLLLLPVFFGVGWVAARIDMRQVVRASSRLPRIYLTGLNHLLHDELDQAIEAFLSAARENPATLELQLALAVLFRRRGEFDRAIRIHQELLAREDLSEERRSEILAELALDYHKAGFFDRAEALYAALQQTERKHWALAQLLEIYQVEKDWRKCIDVATRLARDDSPVWRVRLIHYHCELAALALTAERWDEAGHHLEQARAIERHAVRPILLEGERHFLQGRFEAAFEEWLTLERIAVEHLPLAIDRLMAVAERCGWQAKLLKRMRQWLHRYPQLDLVERYVEFEARHGEPATAMRLLQGLLRQQPSLIVLDEYLLLVARHVDPAWLADVERVREVVHGYVQRLARYRCTQCGFKARRHLWRCPACGQWETFGPARVIEIDAIAGH
ncbi:lipopolysaccharide assembly protein LapB [Tepidiphilus succinatimandens]|uniref:lipopolysaccharide assembly protein LapB n=1 Tax=Tepidiphilus succinatimandens TaxID=224436 RepID=UPI00112F5DC1|nr:lipopolysaccharide assembly protein LapB [Tepidiphilus succinatimandens]